MRIHGQRYEVDTIVDAVPGAREAREAGTWPSQYFGRLLVPVAVWSSQHPTRYHHTGYTFPDHEAFQAATEAAGPDLVASDLPTAKAYHHRRYLRTPSADGGPDSFQEYHVVGDEGNGIQGVHFDFITDDPSGMLEEVMAGLEGVDSEGIQVVTQSFGGGDAPVGKVGLQPAGDPSVEVGVMARTHWSDPVNW